MGDPAIQRCQLILYLRQRVAERTTDPCHGGRETFVSSLLSTAFKNIPAGLLAGDVPLNNCYGSRHVVSVRSNSPPSGWLGSSGIFDLCYVLHPHPLHRLVYD